MNKLARRLSRIGVLTVLFAVAASHADAGNFSPNISIQGSVQGSTQSLKQGGGQSGGTGHGHGYGYGYGYAGPPPPGVPVPKRPFHFFNPNTQFSGPGYYNNSTNGLAAKGLK